MLWISTSESTRRVSSMWRKKETKKERKKEREREREYLINKNVVPYQWLKHFTLFDTRLLRMN